MNEYREALRRYADFTGRSARRDYWMFFLFNALFSAAAGIIDSLLRLGHNGGGPISGLYSLALLIPSLAIAVRRLHDTNRSGWWMFIVLIPLAGLIVLIVFLAQRGTPGFNSYGPEPVPVAFAPAPGAAYPGGAPYSSSTPGAAVPYAGTPAAPTPPAPPAPPVPQVKQDGWYPDPTGRHELRYRRGDVWTEHVSDAGATGQDPI